MKQNKNEYQNTYLFFLFQSSFSPPKSLCFLFWEEVQFAYYDM